MTDLIEIKKLTFKLSNKTYDLRLELEKML